MAERISGRKILIVVLAVAATCLAIYFLLHLQGRPGSGFVAGPGQREMRALARDSDILAALSAEHYEARFETASKRLRAARGVPLYSKLRCELSDVGWRYRKSDEFAPLSTDQDWSARPDTDANWIWRHQNLYLLDCYMAMYLDRFQPETLEDIHALIRDWVADNQTDGSQASVHAWGDHVTALRLRNVIELYIELRTLGSLSDELAVEIVRFVESHTDRLLHDKKVIRRKHNHALDQVNALALSHAFFPFLEYGATRLDQEVVDRFKVERNHLIADDGVSTENSPGYHLWVPARVTIMEDSFEILEERDPGARDQLRSKTLDFVTWVQTPRGPLPQIGDTPPRKRGFVRWQGMDQLSSYPAYRYVMSKGRRGSKPTGSFRIFPDAGYFIYRNDWDAPLGDDDHVVLKCGFRAESHRHSDDGTFTLFSGGEEWFIDTGMYGYATGPKRAHALEPAAHNVSYVPGDTVRSTSSRRHERYRTTWGLSGFATKGERQAHVTCTSFMFPEAVYKRTMEVDGTRIRLADTFRYERDGQVPTTRFQVPYDKSIKLQSPGAARVCAKGGRCIDLDFSADGVDSVRVIDGKDVENDAFRTRAYLKSEPSRVLEIRWRPGVESMRFTITL